MKKYIFKFLIFKIFKKIKNKFLDYSSIESLFNFKIINSKYYSFVIIVDKINNYYNQDSQIIENKIILKTNEIVRIKFYCLKKQPRYFIDSMKYNNHFFELIIKENNILLREIDNYYLKKMKLYDFYILFKEINLLINNIEKNNKEILEYFKF